MSLTSFSTALSAGPLPSIILSKCDGVGFTFTDPGTYEVSCEFPWGYHEDDSQAFEDMVQVDAGETITITVTNTPVTKYCKLNMVGELRPLRISYDQPDPIALAGGEYDGVSQLVMADGANIEVSEEGTGSMIGATPESLLAFWGTTPLSQPADADQAAAAAQTQDSLTDSSGGTASTTLAAIDDSLTGTDGVGNTAAAVSDVNAQLTIIANAIASLAAQLAKVKADVTADKTLGDAMRDALVDTGIMKGGA
jgi:hypothetical protein